MARSEHVTATSRQRCPPLPSTGLIPGRALTLVILAAPGGSVELVETMTGIVDVAEWFTMGERAQLIAGSPPLPGWPAGLATWRL